MRVQLPSGTPAELAVPDGDGTRGVVVAADIGGLRPLFDDLATRLAGEHGWAVCVVEPWGDGAGETLEERLGAVGGLDDARQVGDLVDAAALLRERTGTDRLAVIGFCMGGMYAMKASPTGAFDRAVAFYGMIRVPEQWRGPGQADAVDAVRADGTCAVLAIIGTADVWTPAGEVAELEAAGAEVVRYEGAEHGFVHDPDRPAHRPDDAADAWRRVVDFLS
jgi:carboxymethylenebutenolidase